jgi:hypothetical protein
MTLDTSAYRQGYYFNLADEAGLAELFQLNRNYLFDWPSTNFVLTFLDTSEKTFENNNIEVARVSFSLEKAHIGGIDMRLYNKDNVWETQSSRLIKWDGHLNGQAFAEDSELRDLNSLTGPIIPVQSYEAVFNFEGKEIGIEKTAIPMTGQHYLKFFSTTAGPNFRPILGEKDGEIFSKKQAAFNRSNFLGMLGFIETAYSLDLIEPITEMPAAFIRKDMARFG